MYLSRSDPKICYSITYTESIIKRWNIRKKKVTKTYQLYNILPSELIVLDHRRVVMYESNKNLIFVYNFVKEKIVHTIDLEESNPNLRTNCIVYVKRKNELVLLSQTTNDLIILDLKKGRLFTRKSYIYVSVMS